MAKKPKVKVESLTENPVILSVEILKSIDCVDHKCVVEGEFKVIWDALYAIKTAAGPGRWNQSLLHVLTGDDPAPDWLAALPEWTALNDTLNTVYGRAHP